MIWGMPDDKVGKRLINAAKSAKAIARGEADPKACFGPPRRAVTKLKMSQNAFAAPCHPRCAIGNGIDAIQMEQRAFPLMVIDTEPDVVTRQLIYVSPVDGRGTKATPVRRRVDRSLQLS